MKSQDVKKSNSEAIKNMKELEGNLSTFHFIVLTLAVQYVDSRQYGYYTNISGFVL